MQPGINLLVILVVYLTKIDFANSNKHTIIPNNNQLYINNPPSHQVHFDFQADLFDYWVKLLPNEKQEPECSIKKISPTYLSTVKIMETLELQKTDLIRCEIVNQITERKPLFIIQTSSTTSESPDVTKFANPTEENCFSFRVKTKGVAEIYLYSDLNSFKHVVITLGTGNNTESSMRDMHGTCSNCKNEKTYKILNGYEHKGFWISVDKNTITVGREDETELFSNKFYNNFGEVRFIGVATSGNVDYGSWKIMEPFCPSSLKRPNKEHSYVTKCHKMFDKTALRLSDLSLEDKILKKVKALEEEFNTEIVEIRISKNRLSDYYISNLNELYIEFLDVLRKCRKRQCENTESIQLKIDELRTTLQKKIKELIESPNCSSNGKYEEVLDKCTCTKGFAGNGYYCEKDSDGDKVPDKNIKECNGQLECKMDNCIKVFNPNQSDWNSDGKGDVCENLVTYSSAFNFYNYANSNNIEPVQTTEIYDIVETPMNDERVIKINCANISIPELKTGQKCVLASDFFIPLTFNESKIEVLFSQINSTKMFKFSWNNKDELKFKLNIVNDLNETADNFDSKLIWEDKKPRFFEKARNYRFFINYNSNKLQIRIDDFKGQIIDTTVITTNDIKDGLSIGKICSSSEILEWFGSVVHHCK